MQIVAFITEPNVIGNILRHLAAKGIDARSPPTAHTECRRWSGGCSLPGLHGERGNRITTEALRNLGTYNRPGDAAEDGGGESSAEGGGPRCEVGMMLRRAIWAFGLNALAFAAAQGVWLLVRPEPRGLDVWVLSRTNGIVLAAALVFAASCWPGHGTRPFLPAGPSLLLAAYGGMYFSLTAIFFVLVFLGPTAYLWPVTLAIDYVIVAPVVGVAWGAVALWGSLAERTRRRDLS